jgi:orotidine-5'-phosphate decarboxylase
MNPIILALDFSNIDDARSLLKKVRNHIGMIKIGLELWSAYGPESLNLGNEFHLPMFVDLKLYDIPNTVSKTITNIINKDKYDLIKLTTVHILGGKDMLTASVNAVNNSPTNIAAVGLLTSLDDSDVKSFGINGSVEDKVIDFAFLAKGCGIKHFICSPQNANSIRTNLSEKGYDPVLICPGIRNNQTADDQKRTSKLSSDIAADHFVIGRPITQAKDPVEAAKSFLEALK